MSLLKPLSEERTYTLEYRPRPDCFWREFADNVTDLTQGKHRLRVLREDEAADFKGTFEYRLVETTKIVQVIA